MVLLFLIPQPSSPPLRRKRRRRKRSAAPPQGAGARGHDHVAGRALDHASGPDLAGALARGHHPHEGGQGHHGDEGRELHLEGLGRPRADEDHGQELLRPLDEGALDQGAKNVDLGQGKISSGYL